MHYTPSPFEQTQVPSQHHNQDENTAKKVWMQAVIYWFLDEGRSRIDRKHEQDYWEKCSKGSSTFTCASNTFSNDILPSGRPWGKSSKHWTTFLQGSKLSFGAWQRCSSHSKKCSKGWGKCSGFDCTVLEGMLTSFNGPKKCSGSSQKCSGVKMKSTRGFVTSFGGPKKCSGSSQKCSSVRMKPARGFMTSLNGPKKCSRVVLKPFLFEVQYPNNQIKLPWIHQSFWRFTVLLTNRITQQALHLDQ